ncbi:MAG: dissimilatory sulfite reductase D family protein [Deltaproteobacteria bacterium]|nr:dissimilatory sulfite reductase D family protein [Deltaproteobacteria bacterium]MBW2071805.1 dissimilatory sulfite reductase D family protein [Deltaproteobacteria bacterium]
MSEEAKKAILDFMAKKKGKTKHYFNELCKAVPEMKMRQAKKVINEMVNEGKLKYWSSGSTTMYMLPGEHDLEDEEKGM